MTKRNLEYWISTGLVASVMTASGSLAVMHVPQFMQALEHLGYPRYFANLLGVGKLTGVVVLLAPGLPKLKEWAYVAFGITILSACYSHFSSGDGWLALEPLATFLALVVSYLRRPADGRTVQSRRIGSSLPASVVVESTTRFHS
jgi:uncharacterized membrane protein YphA (DoxX/SURF4 family)